jgi:hypothetical protein
LLNKTLAGGPTTDVPKNILERVHTIKDAINQSLAPADKVGTGQFYHATKDIPAQALNYFSRKFTPEADKSGGRVMADVLKGAIDLPKAALFAFPFAHMANITGLQLLADPGALPGTMKNFAQLMLTKNNAAKQAALRKPAFDAGVIGAANVNKSPSSFVQLLNQVPGLKQTAGNLYNMSGDVLWTYDDAAKMARYERLTKSGLSPAEAARRTNMDLLNYGDKSPLTNALQYVAPFASYRTKMPGAVARSVLTHPERTQVAGRISPALVGQDQDMGDGSGQAIRNYLPLADTMRGAADPMGFVRSSMGFPLAMSLSAAGVDAHKYPNYFTYGKKMDSIPSVLKYGANQVPYVSDVLSAFGLGEFPTRGTGAQGFINNQVGAQTRTRVVNESPSEMRFDGPTPQASGSSSVLDAFGLR